MTERRAGQAIFLALSLPVLLVGVVLVGRLILVLGATPVTNWLDEFTPLTSRDAFPAALSAAVAVRARVRDAAIAGTLLTGCGAGAPAGPCLDAVDYGLSANAVSAELWLERSQLLAGAGAFDERMARALSASYDLAPYDGWIAAARLPLALRVRSFLPAQAMEDIGRDIETVLSRRQLALPLIEAYIADPIFRDQTFDVIERYASFDQQEQLIAWIRGEL